METYLNVAPWPLWAILCYSSASGQEAPSREQSVDHPRQQEADHRVRTTGWTKWSSQFSTYPARKAQVSPYSGVTLGTPCTVLSVVDSWVIRPLFFFRRPRSEYASNYRSPTKFQYDGAWHGADPPHLQPTRVRTWTVCFFLLP